MYKAVTPRRGWLRILWDRGKQHEDNVADHIVAACEIPGCRLLNSGNALDLPCTAWMLPEVSELLALLQLPTPALAALETPAWTPLQPLYSFQHEPLARFTRDVPGLLLADDMGLGKTREAIAAGQQLRLKYPGQPGLIVAPLFTRDVWRRELQAMGAGSFHALAGVNVGAGLPSPPPDWYFCHYDVVEAWAGQFRARAAEAPVVAVLDEAHWVKNSNAKRSRGARFAALGARYRILLTGTPMENRPSELWHLLTLVTGESSWGYFSEFRQRYAGARSNGYGLEDIGPTHVEELRTRMAPFYLRRTLPDVAIELPPLTRTLFPVGREHLDAKHDAILRDTNTRALVNSLLDGFAGGEVLAVISQLRQLTSRAKLKATVDFTRNALDQGQSVVVFTWERATASKIATQLAAVNDSLLVTGEQLQPVRDATVAEFQAFQRPVALVATLGSLREGVTLHHARTVVMHDLHWVLAHMLQAEKRVHRIGQVNPCQSVWMVIDDSIDALLARVLVEKAAAADTVLGIGEGRVAVDQLSLDVMKPIEDQLSAALAAWEAA